MINSYTFILYLLILNFDYTLITLLSNFHYTPIKLIYFVILHYNIVIHLEEFLFRSDKRGTENCIEKYFNMQTCIYNIHQDEKQM